MGIKLHDYDNTDTKGLREHLKNIDWQKNIYDLNAIDQPAAMSRILIDALDKFVPIKSYTARSQDQPWATAHTRLLLRKKNRNYKIFRLITHCNNNNIISERQAAYLKGDSTWCTTLGRLGEIKTFVNQLFWIFLPLSIRFGIKGYWQN